MGLQVEIGKLKKNGAFSKKSISFRGCHQLCWEFFKKRVCKLEEMNLAQFDAAAVGPIKLTAEDLEWMVDFMNDPFVDEHYTSAELSSVKGKLRRASEGKEFYLLVC